MAQNVRGLGVANQPQCSSQECSVVERVVVGKLGEEDDVQGVVVRVRGDKNNTNKADDGKGNCFEETTNEFLSHDHTCQIALCKNTRVSRSSQDKL